MGEPLGRCGENCYRTSRSVSREGLRELCLVCSSSVRGDVVTIFHSLRREEQFANRGLFCLVVQTVTRSRGWKAVTLIHLDQR